jgi:hypothetical protein
VPGRKGTSAREKGTGARYADYRDAAARELEALAPGNFVGVGAKELEAMAPGNWRCCRQGIRGVGARELEALAPGN